MQNCKTSKMVFKILAFTFLYEIGYFLAKTAGDATICTNLNSTYTRMLCVQKLKFCLANSEKKMFKVLVSKKPLFWHLDKFKVLPKWL